MLAGLDVERLELPTGGTTFAMSLAGTDWAAPVAGEDLRAVWRETHQRVAALGLWPVAVSSSSPQDPEWDLILADWGRPMCDLVDDVRRLPVEEAVRRFNLHDGWWWDHGWTEHVARELGRTHARVGSAPELDALISLDDKPTASQLEKLLFEFEEGRRPTVRPEDPGHLAWFEPDETIRLVLLPATSSGQASLHLDFFGAETVEAAVALAAVLDDWQQRFGAHLVANWGTMLQFVVDRPPSTPSEAFELAQQHDWVGGSTLAGPGLTVRDHARALLGRDTWFLHHRP